MRFVAKRDNFSEIETILHLSCSLVNADYQKYIESIKKEQNEILKARAAAKPSELLTIVQARKNAPQFDWKNYTAPKPTFLGTKVFDSFRLNEIAERIDWSPFFLNWELKGLYPKIFSNPKVGKQAEKLFDDAKNLLNKIIKDNLLTAKAVIGFYPANSINDDIELYADDTRKESLAILHTLRQQVKKPSGQSNTALSDFIAPKKSACPDYIGMFAVTSGIGIDDLCARFEKEKDDYNKIMAKALANRLAEAFAEKMHELVRTKYWGYATQEHLSSEEIISEAYRGIRPAPGYPACPDHTEKLIIFDILKARKATTISLTESFAMHPSSSVCGLYFSHPKSHYFGIGKIGQDQIIDYANRKKMSTKTAERWISPHLGYNT